MAGKTEKRNREDGSSDAYDFSSDSKIKDVLLAKIKREYFGAVHRSKRLEDDELELAVAAAKPKPDDKTNRKPPQE